MRTPFILFFAFLWAIPFSYAQVQLVNTSTSSIKAQIDLANGTLSRASTIGEKINVQDMELSLLHGELVLDYELVRLSEESDYYEIKELQLALGGNTLELLPEQIKGKTGKITEGGPQQLVLANLLDQFINLKGEVTVSLLVDHWGVRKLAYGVDCSQPPPSFNGKQRSPYFIAAGLGAAAIGAGQYFRIQSEKVYEENYLTAETAQVADPLYKDANGKHHTYLILTYGGSALLAADIILYFIRDSRYRKRIEVYRNNCSNTSLLLEPIIETPSFQKPNGQAGLRFTLNF